jgi:hypothetical protein
MDMSSNTPAPSDEQGHIYRPLEVVSRVSPVSFQIWFYSASGQTMYTRKTPHFLILCKFALKYLVYASVIIGFMPFNISSSDYISAIFRGG